MTTSDRRCHRGERCRDSRRVGGLLLGAEIHTETGLCLTCTRVVTDAITELPADYVSLSGALERGASGMVELVSASPDPPCPIRIDVAALRDEIVRVATTWAEPVADLLRIRWDTQAVASHTRPAVALDRATRILAGALPALLNLRAVLVQTWADNGRYWSHEPADGIDGALELLRLHDVTRAALGRTTLVHQLGVPCPSVKCGANALVRHNGADDVLCEACGDRWPYEQWRRLTLVACSPDAGIHERQAS